MNNYKSIEVHSVADFIEKSKQVLENEELIYYRGESQEYGRSKLIPSLIRRGLPEYQVINEYVKQYPEKFDALKNNTARLSLMQHMTLPTRLLDITRNKLVALFFATLSNDEEDGYVYVFKPNKEVKYGTYSDTVEILSTLAFMDEDAKNEINALIQDFIDEVIKSGITEAEYVLWYRKLVESITITTNVNCCCCCCCGKKCCEEKTVECRLTKKYMKINQNYQVLRLYHMIKQDVGDFQHVIDFGRMLEPEIFESSITSERLKNQQGSFIIIPDVYRSKPQKNVLTANIDKIHCKLAKLQVKDQTSGELIRFKVPAGVKQAIHAELDKDLNINKGTMFTDMESMAQYISEKFS
ncbi:FRG domain-containing protein [Ligilactobacillus equi]|uniref:FRG domain-containing protein n=1 Tax=Ligilactobacillus equi TaxID=137357 RepID=UPI00046822DC|nr:FRG domain-containing protein [Ligilactobacillus equi]